jgi:hypothetical protein
LYVLGALGGVAFVILVISDWGSYNDLANSAPFYLFVVARIVLVLLPSILLVIIGLIVGRRLKPFLAKSAR